MCLKAEGPGGYSVGLYIRLSREDEKEGPSESVTNQKALLMDYAQKQGLRVFDIYIDDGWSGTGFDRPGFNRLVADIKAKRVNMVITKDLSRLGRDYIMTGHYMERFFPEHRVRYISLLDGIDTGVESTANDITPFRAIMNDMYAKDISKKITSVKRDKQRRGLFIGGKPMYGYKMHPTEKNQIVVDEGAAPTVRRIFAMALEGCSCRQIAAALNKAQVAPPAVYAGRAVKNPGPYGGLWSGERIAEMLANETYIGSMVQGRTKKVSYKSTKSVRLPPESWVVVAGTHQPLVSAEDFKSVGLMLESRRHTRSRSYDFLLKGLIYCRECGSPMAVINRKKPGGQDCLYFVCRSYQRFTKAGTCSCHCIKEETVTRAVAAAVEALCRRRVGQNTLVPQAQAAVMAAQGRKGPDKKALEVRAAALATQLDRVYGDRLSGLLAEADFARIYQRIKAERAQLEKRLEKPKAQKPADADIYARAQALAEEFIFSCGHSREVLVSLIERVEFSRDRALYVCFRCPEPGETEERAELV